MFRKLNRLNSMSERGSAFIITLWLVAMIGVIVSAFTLNAIVNQQMSEALNQVSAGSGLARAGVEAWMAQLRADAITADVDLVATEIMNYYPPRAIRINEVDGSENCTSRSDESVEIYNAAPKESSAISISDWTVKAGGTEFEVFTSGSLKPGEIKVASGSGHAGTLNNGGERVTLHNSDGQIVDEFEYTEAPNSGKTWSVLPDGQNGIKPAEHRASSDTAWVSRDCSMGDNNAEGMWAKVGNGDTEGLKLTQYDEDGNKITVFNLGSDVSGPSDPAKWVDRFFINSNSGTGTFVLTNGLGTGKITSTFKKGDTPSASMSAQEFNYSDTTMYMRVDVPKPVYGDKPWTSYRDTDIIAPAGSTIDQSTNKIPSVDASISSDAGQLGHVVRIDTEVVVPDNVTWGDSYSSRPDPGTSDPSFYTGSSSDYVFSDTSARDGKLYVSEVFDTVPKASFSTEYDQGFGGECSTTCWPYTAGGDGDGDSAEAAELESDGAHAKGTTLYDFNDTDGGSEGDWIAFDTLDLSAYSQIKISALVGKDNTADPGEVVFEISKDGGASWSEAKRKDASTIPADSWAPDPVEFTVNNPGANFKFRIRQPPTVAWSEHTGIDNVKLKTPSAGSASSPNEFVELMLFGTPDKFLEDKHEFVELFNTSSDTIDLSGASIKDSVDAKGNPVSADDYNFVLHPDDPKYSGGGGGGDLRLPPGQPYVGLVMPTSADSSVLGVADLVDQGLVRLFSLENASTGSTEFFTGGLYNKQMEHLVLSRPTAGDRRTLDSAESWDKKSVSPWESRLKSVVDGDETAENWSPSGFGGTPGVVPGAGDSYWDAWGWKGELFSGVAMADTVYLPSGSTTPGENDIGGFKIIRIEDESGKQSLSQPPSELALDSQNSPAARTMTASQAEEVVKCPPNGGSCPEAGKRFFWMTPGDMVHISAVGLGTFQQYKHNYSTFRDTSITPVPVNINTASYEALRGIKKSSAGDYITDEEAKTIIDERSGKTISTDSCVGNSSCEDNYPELSQKAYPESSSSPSAFTSTNEVCNLGFDNFDCAVFREHTRVSSDGIFTVYAKGFTLDSSGNILSEVILEATVDRRPVTRNSGPMELIYMRMN